MKNILTIILIVLSGSCGKRSDVIQEVRNGINGEAVYVLSNDGSVDYVYKKKYNGHEYIILLYGDTVRLNEGFESLIHVANPDFRITISSPSNAIIMSDEVLEPKRYQFLPSEVGIYDYKGVIEYDSVSVPFEYKFIVVPKK